MGHILTKLCENVGTSGRLIVSKFRCATPLGLCATRKSQFKMLKHIRSISGDSLSNETLNFGRQYEYASEIN